MIIRFKQEITDKKNEGTVTQVEAATIVGFLPHEAPDLRKITVDGEEISVLSASKGSNFAIGYDKDYKGEDKGFISLELWGKKAEMLKKHAYKGMPIAVSGRIKKSTYKSNGEERVSERLVVDTFKILRFKKKEEGQNQPTSSSPQTSQPSTPAQTKAKESVVSEPQNFDGAKSPILAPDDLPF